MNKFNLIILVIAVLCSTSCKSKRKFATSDTMHIVKPNIIAIPQVADLNIETRQIEGVAEVRKKDYYPYAKQACISLAVKNAVLKGNCDVIVQPVYELEETRKIIRVKVTGFAATYKKFRPIELSDTTAFIVYSKLALVANPNIAVPQTSPSNTMDSPMPKKRRIGLVIIGALLVIPSLITILFP